MNEPDFSDNPVVGIREDQPVLPKLPQRVGFAAMGALVVALTLLILLLLEIVRVTWQSVLVPSLATPSPGFVSMVSAKLSTLNVANKRRSSSGSRRSLRRR